MTKEEVSTQPQFTTDHPDIEISPAQERDDTLAYMKELEKRVPIAVGKSRALLEGQPESLTWRTQVGEYWRDAREAHHLSRYGLAAKVSTNVNNVRLLERGLLEIEEMEGFIEPYAKAIGDPGLSTEFSQRFGIREVTPPPATR